MGSAGRRMPVATAFFAGGPAVVIRGGFGHFFTDRDKLKDQIQPNPKAIVLAQRLPVGLCFTFNPGLRRRRLVRSSRNFTDNPNNQCVSAPRHMRLSTKVPEKNLQFHPSQCSRSWLYQGSLRPPLTSAVRDAILFLRGLYETRSAGYGHTFRDGTAIPTDAGVVNRTNAAGRVIGVYYRAPVFASCLARPVQNPIR
jgi:hypothetical protein